MTKFVFWKFLICSHFILIWVTVWQILDSIWRSMDFWDKGLSLQVEWSVQIVELLADCLTFHLLPISHKESESVGCSFVSNSLQPHGCKSHKAHLSMGFSRQEYSQWVVIPFSRGSSQPRGWTQVSCIAAGFFTIWATLFPIDSQNIPLQSDMFVLYSIQKVCCHVVTSSRDHGLNLFSV